MSYLNIRSSKKEPCYLTVFLPILLVACSITLSSANAVEVFRMDDGRGSLEMERMEEFQLPGENLWEPEDVPHFGVPYDDWHAAPLDDGTIKNLEYGSSWKSFEHSILVQPKWVLMDPPQRVSTVTYQDSSTGAEVTKAWSQLKNSEILRLLTNTSFETHIGRLDASGNVNYTIANATGEKGKYRIVIDDILYRQEKATNKSGTIIGDGKVGIGSRLTANINTYEANINLNSLAALGLAARANKLDGYIKTDIIGIRTEDSNDFILSSTEINDTSILYAIRALDILKSKIPNSDTHLDPQVLWVKPRPYYEEVEDIVKEKRSKKLSLIERIKDFFSGW